MPTTNNPLSAISYTNKDFQSIFPELLDLVKKLTLKWDPSISNESDPGVILLKLNAIIADKNNYNIDKNILEAFPETVTQEVAARNMYKQLAYQMPWYQSATTTITFRWLGESLTPGETVTIPAFTMITNSDTSIIYTIIDEVQFSYENTIVTGRAMQGTITDLIVNGTTTLNLNNIDYNNRLYLNDYNVAENGIFISNAEEPNMGYWEKVDNLQIVPLENRYYEFGVDSRNNSTYIEFPSDLETLIRAGLNVKYLISSGTSGNVSANQLTNFYEDVTITFRDEELNLNSDIIQMYNASATTDGQDPEPVSEAYESYRRVAGTFDTLVTLRDYINAIYLSGFVSNDIVSDRLTDIQSSYKIVVDEGSTNGSIIEYARHQVEGTSEYQYDMTPYDLKLYLLHNSGVINSLSSFNASFDIEASDSNVVAQVENYLQSTRCIQHNFIDILPDIPCMFRNIYSIKIKFVPQYQLSNVQVDSVRRNIIQALYDNLNAREVNFSEEPDYNVIYDIIMAADERIKLITIDTFVYTTYATYWDSETQTFKHIPVSDFNDPWIVTANTLTDLQAMIPNLSNASLYTFVATTDNTVYKYNASQQALEEYSTYINNFRQQIIAKNVLAGVTPLYDQENSFSYSIDQIFDSVDKEVDRVSTSLVISPWGFDEGGVPKEYDSTTTDTSKNYTLKDNETLQFLAPSFISEINYSSFVKYELVLQNQTSEPEYRQASISNFSYTQGTYNGSKTILYSINETGQYEAYVNLAQEGSSQAPYEEGTLNWFKFDNTAVQGQTGTYTPYEAWNRGLISLYSIEAVYRIAANTDYKLKYGDSITFFWRDSDEEDAPYLYRCYKGLQVETETERSPIIKATFTLNGTNKSNAQVNPDGLNTSGQLNYDVNPYSSYQRVLNMYGANVLSGTKSIDIRRINQLTLSLGNNYYYFITNNIDTSGTTDKYIMEFQASPAFIPNKYYAPDSDVPLTEEPEGWGYSGVVYRTKSGNTYEDVTFYYDYTLQADEYFIYMNLDLTTYEMLAQGTLIKLLQNPVTGALPVFTVDAINYNNVALNGTSAITEFSKLLPVDTLVREQQIYNLVGGDTVNITIDKAEFTGMTYLNENSQTVITFPYFLTQEAHSTDGLTISYATGSQDASSTFQELPGIAIDDISSNWVGRAVLNLDLTYEDAQIIDNSAPATQKQSLQQVTIDRSGEGTESPSYPEGNPYDSESKINLLSNAPINRSGGTSIDVTYVNLLGDTETISIFAFEINPAFVTAPFSTSASQGIRMAFVTTDVSTEYLTVSTNAGITSATVSGIRLESGYNYILGIRNTSESQKFWLRYGNSTGNFVNCLNSSLNTDNEGLAEGVYYFILDNTDTSNLITSLTFQISGADNTGFLELDQLVKCTPNESFAQYGINIEDLEELVAEYDYNGVFKYNYQIPTDVLIENPLEADTFFNENHICNPYTISFANLVIPADATKSLSKASSIDVINNR